MEDFTQLYSSHGRGLELFAKQRSRPAPVVDMTALAKEVGTTSRNIYAPGSFRTYFSHVGNYLAFAKATNAPHDAGCPPGVPVTFQVLLNYFVWYVALKPNQRHPNQPHAASTLHVMMAAIKSAALADSWCRNEANAEAFGGVPGFAITLGDRHVLNGVIRALAKLHPTDDAEAAHAHGIFAADTQLVQAGPQLGANAGSSMAVSGTSRNVTCRRVNCTPYA